MSPDYSTYSDKELAEAFSSIDRLKYPANFETLKEEITLRKYSAEYTNKSNDQSQNIESIFRSTRKKYYVAVIVLVVSLVSIFFITVGTGNHVLATPILIFVYFLGNYYLSRLLNYKCLNCNQAALRNKFSPNLTGRCAHCDAKIP
ncbi:hypothetical protein [Alkalimarinus alittae]|uniref:Uncharacterized protein n=1 Tax=Alkalimarinus alittae TaxID=2961619 RepID=A0ABY6N5A7_9ALTE|nr:hypothetical protein [Alkalimarinus alittae]UZE97194.1 hypothetical protein NKI27_05450 [Alkalimarinus alittae]